MRPVRLLAPLVPVPVLTAFLCIGPAMLTACGGGGTGGGGAGTGSTTGTGASASSDCFDYTGFQGMTPAVGFSADVLPIFSGSCAISASCHGCNDTPTCTDSGVKPYLGTAVGTPAPTPAQIAAIFATTVNQPAVLQPWAVDPSDMVGDPSMKIVVPGEPENSFMMYKLDGDPNAADMMEEVSCSTLTCASGMTCGSAMPSGGPQLSSTDRDTIRRWIAQGAKND